MNNIASDKEFFTNIYNNRIWGNGSTASASGADGSSMEYTANLRNELPKIFQLFGIRSLLDAPCGDMWWMPSVLRQVDIQYTGGDIVDNLINDNQNKFRNTDLGHLKFQSFDIRKDTFPAVDLWFCRDCMFHLTNDDIKETLINFAKSDVKYIMTTTHLFDSADYDGTPFVLSGNKELPQIGFRLLNLFAKPYNFPQPLYRCDDTFSFHPRREMCVWSRAQVVEALINNR